LVVDQLLKSLKTELVEVVVNFDHLGDFLLVLGIDTHHFFWINQRSKMEDHRFFRNAHLEVALIDIVFHVDFETSLEEVRATFSFPLHKISIGVHI